MPVVALYSPGANATRAFGTGVVEDMGSHGYLVVTIGHTYDAAVPGWTPRGGPSCGVDRGELLNDRSQSSSTTLVASPTVDQPCWVSLSVWTIA